MNKNIPTEKIKEIYSDNLKNTNLYIYLIEKINIKMNFIKRIAVYILFLFLFASIIIFSIYLTDNLINVIIISSGIYIIPWSLTSIYTFIKYTLIDKKCCHCLCWLYSLRNLIMSIIIGFFWWTFLINILFFDNPFTRSDEEYNREDERYQ